MRIHSAVLVALLAAPALASYDEICGFEPETDVVERSEIDQDVKEMVTAGNTDDFAEMYRAYSVGGNSLKGSGSTRTIKGFSVTNPYDKLAIVPEYNIKVSYWTAFYSQASPLWSYADHITGNACQGTGEFATAGNNTRVQMCKKGALVLNVYGYILYELYDMIRDCNNGNANDNDGSAQALDEAVAFTAGSAEGPDCTGTGYLFSNLMYKRGKDFGTMIQGSNVESQANADVFALYKEAKVVIQATPRICANLGPIVEKISNKLKVPLVQGVLRYAYKADPARAANGGEKALAEGWAFLSAILPKINSCNPELAEDLKANFQWNTQTPIRDGYKEIVKKMQSVYQCLGVTCSDIGSYLDATGTKPVEGMEACQDPSTGGGSSSNDDNNQVSSGAIAGIVIAVIVVVLLIAAGVYYLGRKQGKYDAFMEEEAKSNKADSSVAAGGMNQQV